MKKFWKKNQETEDEEVIELTPEEKKEKAINTIKGAAKAVAAMAVGAGLTILALAKAGGKAETDSEESDDDVVEDSCEVENSEVNSEE